MMKENYGHLTICQNNKLYDETIVTIYIKFHVVVHTLKFYLNLII